MFKKLMELIKQALASMTSMDKKDSIQNIVNISDEMIESVTLWKDVYKDSAPWLNLSHGIYSLGLAKDICQKLSTMVLCESKIKVVDANGGDGEEGSKVKLINDALSDRLLKGFRSELEKGMATGGMIVKPYASNGQIYFDICRQGDFAPIGFDDDGRIIDCAFKEQFVSEGNVYTRVERHIYDSISKTVTIENKAYRAKKKVNGDDDVELGDEIPLSRVDKWSTLSEEPVIIGDVEAPLYGYYRVPIANNVDMGSPLGASVFAPALMMIRKADEQFSRLDWEYEGGQMAIDVDPTALKISGSSGDYVQDQVRNRLYRNLDLGVDDTYHAFAPSLRDASYISGLNKYLCRVEDLVGFARGTLADAQIDARTATEIKIGKQQSFATISDNQKALETCIRDVIRAIGVYINLYALAPKQDYETVIEWSDSVLTDTETELGQRVQLKTAGAMSSAEIRAWYLGEPVEVAKKEVEEIKKEQSQSLLNDIFTSTGLKDGNSLEE